MAGGFLLLGAIPKLRGQEVNIIVPMELADVEGKTGVGLGSVIAESGTRFQIVFDASQFESIPYSQLFITSMLYRPDRDIPFPFSFTQPDSTIRLSTTDKELTRLSLNFDDNSGGDEMIVLQGDVLHASANTGPAEGPKDFDYGLVFETPFHYDPSKGNLLVDVTYRGRTFHWGADQHQITNAPSRYVLAWDPNATTATGRGINTNMNQLTVAVMDAIPGDTNLDGQVDFEDFLNLSANFGGRGSWSEGDSDGSGMIDFADFITLASNFGVVSVVAVPEPTTGMLAGILSLCLFQCFRQRRTSPAGHLHTHYRSHLR
jgi:hypothetical protein